MVFSVSQPAATQFVISRMNNQDGHWVYCWCRWAVSWEEWFNVKTTALRTDDNQIWCVNVGEYTVFGSIVCSDYSIYFSPSHWLSSPFFSLPPSRNSDPGSHGRLFPPPPSPLRFVPCVFIPRRLQLFLPSSTLFRLCLPTLPVLSSWYRFLLFFLCFFFANKFNISPRRDSNSRTNSSSIRGLPLDHRDDRPPVIDRQWVRPHVHDIAVVAILLIYLTLPSQKR